MKVQQVFGFNETYPKHFRFLEVLLINILNILIADSTRLGGEKHKIKETSFALSLHHSIYEIEEPWVSIVPKKLFYSPKYLGFTESNTPSGMKMRYGLFYENDEPVGVLLLQVKKINLGESLTVQANDNKSVKSKLMQGVKTGIAKTISFDTLVVGNLLLTGQYSFYFKDQEVPFYKRFELVEKSLGLISELLKEEGINIGSVLMKDFYDYNAVSKTPIGAKCSFTECKVQPDMVMAVREDWNDFDDYMTSLKSKYRVRIKRAIKKASPIVKRVLSVEELLKYQERIHELYMQTALQANFNLFILPEDYFTEMKRGLGEQFELTGYFLEDVLIGYYTIIFDKDHVDAHFLGYDRSKNAEHQSYLNMLIDILKKGISFKAKYIHFSRTALEIKSSIGAEPEEMVFYLRSQRQWQNKSLVPKMLKLMVPEEKWEPRSPFKS